MVLLVCMCLGIDLTVLTRLHCREGESMVCMLSNGDVSGKLNTVGVVTAVCFHLLLLCNFLDCLRLHYYYTNQASFYVVLAHPEV